MKNNFGNKIALFLIFLMFLSKISFSSFIGFVPRQFSLLIYQGGLHPFVNLFFVFVGGLGLFFVGDQKFEKKQSKVYTLGCLILIIMLTIQTILQILFIEKTVDWLSNIGALFASILLIYVYGRLIVLRLDIKEILNALFCYSSFCLFLSLVVMFVFPENVWKGGRFIGVFKHIPHMVTCASVAFVFSLDFEKYKIWKLLTLPAALYVLLLTGTRSSLVAVLMSFLLAAILIKTRSSAILFLKGTGVLLVTTYTIFFGPMTFDYLTEVARGNKALMEREAQDGVASRFEEIERGWDIFNLNPWLGQGLASKFASDGGASFDKYNSNKDPHNLFVSAGVIGGWPLLLYSVVAFIMLFFSVIKSFMSESRSKKLVAIYLASHLPILIIYHLHLSPGGVADRVYWILFGLLAL